MSPDESPQRKRDVRHSARRRRRELAAGLGVDAGDVITETVLRFLPDAADGPLRVAAYESLPDEPPTRRLIQALLEAGHEVIVPVVLDDYTLEWRYAAEGASGDAATVRRLPRDAPPPSGAGEWLGVDALAECDLIVTPGLAVDRHGTRLGQGGGCYDRALRHRNPAAPVVTLLHEGEASESDLPRDEHDVPVDGYVTTTGRLVRTPPA